MSNILRDIHLTSSNILGFVLAGVLYSTLDAKWWACANGSEEVFLAYFYGSLMMMLGIAGSVLGRHYGYGEKIRYYTELSLRILLIYSMITPAMMKAEGYFYNYSFLTMESKLAEMEANSFANSFFGFSAIYQSFLGYMILLSLLLISYGRSMRLGNLLLFAILSNAVMINHSFDSCFIYKNSIYLAVVSYFIYNDLPSYISFFGKMAQSVNTRFHPLMHNHHLANAGHMFKTIIIVGLVSYNHYFIEDFKTYTSKNAHSPISGIWDVKSIHYTAARDTLKKTELDNFTKIILDNGRFGAVKVQDTLSFFEYMVDPKYNQLEFWNFTDFRNIDLKGKYIQVAPDSMIYVGRNNKDSILISLKLADTPKK